MRRQTNVVTGETLTIASSPYVLDGAVILVDDGDPVPPGAVVAGPSSPPAPTVVTPVQAFTALDQSGHLAPLLAYLDAPDTPPLVRAVALGATEWRRDSLMLMTVSIVLGLTPEQVDALFVTASGVSL